MFNIAGNDMLLHINIDPDFFNKILKNIKNDVFFRNKYNIYLFS